LAKKVTDDDSVVSSESSSSHKKENGRGRSVKSSDSPPATKESSTSVERKKKKNRRSKRTEDDLPFANPPKKHAATPTPPVSERPSKKRKTPNQSTNETSASSTPVKETTTPTRSTKKEKKSTSKSSTKSNKGTGGDLQSLLQSLPVASFTMPNEQDPNTTSNETTSNASEPSDADKTDDRKDVKPHTPSTRSSFPTPSHPDSAKWLLPLERTRNHPRYQNSYDFLKYKAIDEEAGYGKRSWIKAKPYGDWCKDLPQAIAMDCEMCETQDPVSGARDSRALCRISVVNALTGDVLLDSLVKPSWPVSDHRTWINGIEKSHLENVEFTLRHAQAFMLALCSNETVIIGHAVQNDLAAIRMEHHCVVDSAFLFSVKDRDPALCTVSLKDLANALLKKGMPKKHDSVNDARTALECIEHYVEQEGKVEPVVRSRDVRPDTENQLFVHRIPKDCTENHLEKLFTVYSHVVPVKVDPIQRTTEGGPGKAFVHFKTSSHADLAFNTLEKREEHDTKGFLQKKVFMVYGGFLYVRKMTLPKSESEDKD